MARAEDTKKRTKKVGILNWMGTLILSAIPGVNILAMILFIIFAKAPSKRSYAIAWLLLQILFVALFCAAFILFGEQIALFADQLRGKAVLDIIAAVT